MIRLINKVTGTEMWVADDRKEKYLAAGHTLAAGIPKAEKPTEEKPVEKKTVRKAVKKEVRK